MRLTYLLCVQSVSEAVQVASVSQLLASVNRDKGTIRIQLDRLTKPQFTQVSEMLLATNQA